MQCTLETLYGQMETGMPSEVSKKGDNGKTALRLIVENQSQ